MLLLCVAGCHVRQKERNPVPLTGRMTVISKQTYHSRSIVVLKDKETGQEFLWIEYRNCMAITPISLKKER